MLIMLGEIRAFIILKFRLGAGVIGAGTRGRDPDNKRSTGWSKYGQKVFRGSGD